MEVQVLSFAPAFIEISEQLAADGFLGAPKCLGILGGLDGADRGARTRCSTACVVET